MISRSCEELRCKHSTKDILIAQSDLSESWMLNANDNSGIIKQQAYNVFHALTIIYLFHKLNRITERINHLVTSDFITSHSTLIYYWLSSTLSQFTWKLAHKINSFVLKSPLTKFLALGEKSLNTRRRLKKRKNGKFRIYYYTTINLLLAVIQQYHFKEEKQKWKTFECKNKKIPPCTFGSHINLSELKLNAFVLIFNAVNLHLYRLPFAIATQP